MLEISIIFGRKQPQDVNLALISRCRTMSIKVPFNRFYKGGGFVCHTDTSNVHNKNVGDLTF